MKKTTVLYIFILFILFISSCDKNEKLYPTRMEETTEIITSANDTTEIREDMNDTTEVQEIIISNTIEAIPIPVELDISNYPKVDGSTATIPLSQSAFMTLTGASQEEAEGMIVHTKTANAYQRLINKEVDLLIVYAAPDSILEMLANSKMKLFMSPVGKDALVFITNEENTVVSLTENEIIDIYSGEISNWSILGGADSPIVPFQRPDDSGSQTLMKNLVMKDIPFMEAPSSLKPAEMDELIDQLLEYDNTANSIGYSVYYYAKNMYKKPGLKFLHVNQVEPTNETIQNGSYPYVKEFYVVMRADQPRESAAYQVFGWLLSEEGQKLVAANGYVSIR